MKDKILTFIKNTKLALSEKRNRMPKMGFHQKFIAEIEQDEQQLETANGVIADLEEDKPSIAAKLLHHLIEMVIPIFSHWRERISKAESAHGTLAEHIMAKQQYQEQRSNICKLLEHINTLEATPLIAIQAEVENPGSEIVKQYKQQRTPFLATHGIQESPVSTIILNGPSK